jgi:hypothetical protein
MTSPVLQPRIDARPNDGRPRRVDLALARAHLRLGSLALARTELETLAGLGALDGPGLVDLAEVRWRTGDLPGAGEAAVAALDSDAEETVALVIAAEAASADGRPSEARRLAGLAVSRADGGIDRIFAGMPRSAVWHPDAAEPPPAAATLFHREGDEGHMTAASLGADPDGSTEAASGGPDTTTGLWDADAAAGDAAAPEMPDPEDAFHAGRAALVAGSPDEAAFRFGLAIRLAPALAPAVLEATDGARSVPLIVVRGDAFRLVGHESEARQAYALAAFGGPPDRRKRARTGPDAGDPVAEPELTSPSAAGDGAAAATDDAVTAERGATAMADAPEAAEMADPTEAAGLADPPQVAEMADPTEAVYPADLPDSAGLADAPDAPAAAGMADAPEAPEAAAMADAPEAIYPADQPDSAAAPDAPAAADMTDPPKAVDMADPSGAARMPEPPDPADAVDPADTPDTASARQDAPGG